MDGCDCWGLIVLVYQSVGISLPGHDEKYASAEDRRHLDALISGEVLQEWLPVIPGTECHLDGVLLREAGEIRHVGLVADPEARLLLHMVPGVGSVVERYDHGKLRPRVAGFYRHRSLA
jgi:hypothetical protein